MYQQRETNPYQPETNPHFLGPLQPERRQGLHPQPTGPPVQQPRHGSNPYQPETNSHFFIPLQPEPRQDHHPQPTSPPVQQPRHGANPYQPETNPHFFIPLQPEPRQDDHSQPTIPLVQQPRRQRQREQRAKPVPVPLHKSDQLVPPHKLEQLHQDQRQPTHQRVRGPQSQSLDGQEPQDLQHHGNRQPHGLLRPRNQPTKNAFTWFLAIFCAIFWVVIIVGGIIVLIVYLVYRPRSPQFDISSATLNAAYLDMGYLLNADVTLLVNFSNPSKRVSVDFSSMSINLNYGSTLISTQYIEPFSAARGESRFANVHMVSSQVRLPLGESRRLQKQMENNGIRFEVRSFLRTRSNFGSLLRYSYWLHGQCTILVTGPPDGVMTRKACKTKH
ncbi:hypothetical protein FH972_009238 [Carpinus fangiana]|uniref:Late embryogenesis abundant protein LEA-2 subgroup domain-containing protein n=1 Tax=Carpinus fangiana TaxID=176857 RepID=A0A5N6R2V6_9ROSI|nr:hypothetical protein FH972_009238 [Carpinus fangiana]